MNYPRRGNYHGTLLVIVSSLLYLEGAHHWILSYVLSSQLSNSLNKWASVLRIGELLGHSPQFNASILDVEMLIIIII